MNTKCLLLAAALCAAAIPAQGKGGKFTVSGRVEGAAPSDTVVLVRYASFNYSPQPCDVADTLVLGPGGRYSFSGKIASECPAKLSFHSSSPDRPPFSPGVYFALSVGKTEINTPASDFRKGAKIKAPLYDARTKAFLAAEDSLDTAMDSLRARASRATKAKDTLSVASLKAQAAQTKEQQQKLYYDFFKEDTPFAAFAYISTARIYRDDAQGVRKVYEGFSPKAKKSGFAAIVKSKADHADSMRVGNPCPELRLTSRDGKKINLADYAGKYLLISHWSAACGGSHYADPLIAKIYEKYHPFGLEILGTTDPSGVHFNFSDPSKAPKNLKEYILNIFKHPYPDIDLSQGDNYLFERRFDVGGTPYLVFVSPEGKILAVSLGVETLDTVKKTMEQVVSKNR